jgi:hypothetical protein
MLFLGVFAALFLVCALFGWLFATVAARIGMPNDDELDRMVEGALQTAPARATRTAD